MEKHSFAEKFELSRGSGSFQNPSILNPDITGNMNINKYSNKNSKSRLSFLLFSGFTPRQRQRRTEDLVWRKLLCKLQKNQTTKKANFYTKSGQISNGNRKEDK